jgi:hypothetical protein
MVEDAGDYAMSAHKTGIVAFDNAANSAESLRQVQVMSAANQAATMTAEVLYYRTLRSLEATYGISQSNTNMALKSLGWQT